MTRLRLLFFCALVASLALVTTPAQADNLTVQNATFTIFNPLTFSDTGGIFNASGIPDWHTVGTAGSWQPNSTSFSALPGSSNTVGYTNDGSISQTLTGVTVQPNTTYLLSVFVGNRLQGFTGDYTISLDAGATTLCSFSGDSASITPGTFADETCSYHSGSVVPSGNLSILFTSIAPASGAVTQLDVADVSVTTPEPGSMVLMSVGLFCGCIFLALRRKHAGSITV